MPAEQKPERPKEPPPSTLIAEVERCRAWMSIFTAVDYIADKTGADPELLGAAHFYWLLGQHGRVQETAGNSW